MALCNSLMMMYGDVMVFDVLVCLGGARRGSGWWRGVSVSSRPIRRNSHKKVHVTYIFPYMVHSCFGKKLQN